MARTETINQRMRDARRAQILKWALRSFVAKGFSATRISDIAEAAGVAQGLLYHYFRTKEEVYLELIRGAFTGMNEAVDALEKVAGRPHEKIELAMTELLRLLEVDEDFARYFMLTAQASLFAELPREAANLIRRHRRKPYEVMARLMRAGQAEGTICGHDAEALAVVFWTTIKGLAMHRAAFGRQYVTPEPRLLMRIFLAENES